MQRSPSSAYDQAHDGLLAAYRLSYDEGAAEAHLVCGWAQLFLGRFESAIPHLIEAFDRFRDLDFPDGELRTANALGSLLARIGEYEEAIREFTRVCSAARELGNIDREVAALTNLGETYSSMREDEKAEAILTQALDICTDPSVICVIRSHLGRVLQQTGRNAPASVQLVAALEECEKMDDQVTKVDVLTTLGWNALESDPLSAATALDAAIALSRRIEYASGEAGAVRAMHELFLRSGNLEKAESSLGELYDICSNSDIRPQWDSLADGLVQAYADAGDDKGAVRVARRMLAAYREESQTDVARRIRATRARHELERAHLTAAVERTALEEVRRNSRKLELMQAIGAELTATLDLEKLSQLLHDRVNEFLVADVFGIALVSDDQRLLHYDFFIEDNQRLTPLSLSVENELSFGAWVAREKKPIVMKDSDREYQHYVTQRRQITEHRSRTIVYLPLLLENDLVGVLTVQAFEKDAYDDDALEMLRMLAPSVAIAVSNSRKVATIQKLNGELVREKGELEDTYRRIAHMANHDILTGLPNRRLVMELINEYVPLARRMGREFGLLYVDLDDFKPVNDTFGHAAGDEVLRITAERLKDAVRESDTVARLGGDEFVLVIREPNGLSGAVAVAEKVSGVVRAPIALVAGVCTLSASIGVSLFPNHGENYDALLRVADQAMYRAKQAGKAGISVAEGAAQSEDAEFSESRDSTLDQSIASPSKRNQPSTE